jgi:hypothetical protein
VSDSLKVRTLKVTVVTNEVPCIIEGFRFPGKALILLPAADWRWISELNKISSSNHPGVYETLYITKIHIVPHRKHTSPLQGPTG